MALGRFVTLVRGTPPVTIDVLVLCFGNSIHARRRIQVLSDDARFRVTVLTGAAYHVRGTEEHVLRSGGGEVLNHLRALEVLYQLILRRRPDLIVQQTLMYPSYLPMFITNNIPRIVTLWNGDVTWYATTSGLERRIKRGLLEANLRAATAVTVGSEFARAGALAHGAAQERLHVAPYPGVDIERFSAALPRGDARKRSGIAADRAVVLAPRGLAPYQNPMDVVRAVAQVPRRPLLIMLHEPYDDLTALAGLARSLGVDVEFRVKGSFESMPALCRSADVVVSYSSHDSLPNTALETMACGVALVVGDTPPLRELVGGSRIPCVPIQDPAALARAIATSLDSPAAQVEDGLTIARRFDSRVLSPRFRSLALAVAEQGRRPTPGRK